MSPALKYFVAIFLIVALFVPDCVNAWSSSWAYYNTTTGRMVYRKSGGLRIPDFSYAGYKQSKQPLPCVPELRRIPGPINGDNTQYLQNAINQFANDFPLDVDGFRGALVLGPGIYNISGPLTLPHSGMVLRGVGQNTNPNSNTILYATGNATSQPTVLTIGNANDKVWRTAVPGTTVNITTAVVEVNSLSFQVTNASIFRIGDAVTIVHPSTDAFLRSVNYGDTNPPAGGPWQPCLDLKGCTNTLALPPIVYSRYITAVDVTTNTVTIDAPVYNTLNRTLSQSFMFKWANRNRLATNIGLELLRVTIRYNKTNVNQYGVPADENHAWNAVMWNGVENSWARHVTVENFGKWGFGVTSGKQITVYRCQSLSPVGIVTGERMYNFGVDSLGAQLILFHSCFANYGRHAFINNGATSASGIVFHNSWVDVPFASSEGHRQWSQGILFDNIFFNQTIYRYGFKQTIGLMTRGDMGESHGWSSVNSVAWNIHCTKSTAVCIQRPPTAQNYGIAIRCGFSGPVGGTNASCPWNRPAGVVEQYPTTAVRNNIVVDDINPRSLFFGQLIDRIGQTTIDYIRRNQSQCQLFSMMERSTSSFVGWKTDIDLFNLVSTNPTPINPSSTADDSSADAQHESVNNNNSNDDSTPITEEWYFWILLLIGCVIVIVPVFGLYKRHMQSRKFVQHRKSIVRETNTDAVNMAVGVTKQPPVTE